MLVNLDRLDAVRLVEVQTPEAEKRWELQAIFGFYGGQLASACLSSHDSLKDGEKALMKIRTKLGI